MDLAFSDDDCDCFDCDDFHRRRRLHHRLRVLVDHGESRPDFVFVGDRHPLPAVLRENDLRFVGGDHDRTQPIQLHEHWLDA